MALDRSGLLAQTFTLPQQAGPAPLAPKPFTDEIGNPESGLQQIDGVTGEYFDKWAALKGFARDAQENYGVDVRFPDPSIPESIRLNRIYLKSVADLKKQGERLKTGQKMYEAALSRNDLINKDPKEQYFDELQPGNDVVDKELDPIVTEANNKLQQLYFGNAIEEGKQYYDQIKGVLEQRRDSTPSQAAYWQRQIDALTPPTKSVREFAPWHGWKPDANAATKKAKVDAAGQMLKKVANMMEGTAEGYTLSNNTFGPNGERVWVNKDLSEVSFGNGRIKEWQYTPSTGETVLIVERDGPVKSDGTVSKVPERVPLTGIDAVTIAKTITSDNPKFGSAGEVVDLYAQESGLFNDAGEVDPDKLVDPDQRKKKKEYMASTETEEAKRKEKAQMDKLFKQIENMEPGRFFGETQTFKLPNGESIDIYRGNKGYYIENTDQFKSVLGKAQLDKLKKAQTFNQIKNFLLKQSAHLNLEVDMNKLPASGTQSAPNTSNRKDVL